jgi:dTMP kinase
MGRLITFEGIEGSGKTTQLATAAAALARQGVACLATAEPGGTCLGAAIRELLLGAGHHGMAAEAEVLLFAADRAQHTAEVLRPALQRGTVVLCDRFIDATIAYQGFGRGLDREVLALLNRFAAASLRPDLTLLFDLAPEEGLRRARVRSTAAGTGAADRIEGEALAFHRRIREGYLQLAAAEPERFRVVAAGGTVAAVGREVIAHLDRFLGGD